MPPDLLTTPAALIAVLVAGALLLLLVVFILVSPNQAKMRQRRLARIGTRGDADARAEKTKAANVSLRRSTADSSIVAFDRLIKQMMPNAQRLRARLARTGLKITIGRFLVICFATWLLTFAGTEIALHLGIATSALSAVGAGIGLPFGVVNFLGKRRQAKFLSLFPEAIDLIVRGLKSGLPITESIRVVGTEIKDPVGTEFSIVSDAIRFGLTLNEALEQTVQRIDTPEIRFFLIALSVQQETGGNLAETLENLSNVIRRRRQMKLKIKAYSSEAKASAYIIGSLPFIMFGIILMMNYGYVSALWLDPRGITLVGIGLTSYVIGISIMAKMVRFEI